MDNGKIFVAQYGFRVCEKHSLLGRLNWLETHWLDPYTQQKLNSSDGMLGYLEFNAKNTYTASSTARRILNSQINCKFESHKGIFYNIERKIVPMIKIIKNRLTTSFYPW